MTMNVFLPLFIGGLRGWEIIIILVVVLLLFGGKKIPELMRGVGKGIRSFKEGLNDINSEADGSTDSSKKDSEADSGK